MLTVEDGDALSRSSAFFARKFDAFVDSAILDELDARLAQRGVRPDRHAHAP